MRHRDSLDQHNRTVTNSATVVLPISSSIGIAKTCITYGVFPASIASAHKQCLVSLKTLVTNQQEQTDAPPPTFSQWHGREIRSHASRDGCDGQRRQKERHRCGMSQALPPSPQPRSTQALRLVVGRLRAVHPNPEPSLSRAVIAVDRECLPAGGLLAFARCRLLALRQESPWPWTAMSSRPRVRARTRDTCVWARCGWRRWRGSAPDGTWRDSLLTRSPPPPAGSLTDTARRKLFLVLAHPTHTADSGSTV